MIVVSFLVSNDRNGVSNLSTDILIRIGAAIDSIHPLLVNARFIGWTMFPIKIIFKLN